MPDTFFVCAEIRQRFEFRITIGGEFVSLCGEGRELQATAAGWLPAVLRYVLTIVESATAAARAIGLDLDGDQILAAFDADFRDRTP